MVDVVDQQTRSRMMSGIQGKNTAPEVTVRKALFGMGFRYRIHYKKLPGKPDIVLPKYKAIILVNGCFWHGHDCHLFKWPKTRPEFWRKKINGNVDRDKSQISQYHQYGWRVLVVWECAIKGKTKLPFDAVIDLIGDWIMHGEADTEISGREKGKVPKTEPVNNSV